MTDEPESTEVPEGEPADLGPSPHAIAALNTTGVHLETQFSQQYAAKIANGEDGLTASSHAAEHVADNVNAWHDEIVATVPDLDISEFKGLSTHDSIQGRRAALKASVSGV